MALRMHGIYTFLERVLMAYSIYTQRSTLCSGTMATLTLIRLTRRFPA